MPTLLAIDTSSKACSVALIHHQETHQIITSAERQQTRQVLSQIQTILDQFDLTLTQLDALVFSCGPGSFTGIRLAASIIQGLAWGANLPVIPVSTLQAMAQGVYSETSARQIAIITQAYGGKTYSGFYELNVEENRVVGLSEDKIGQPEDLLLPYSGDWVGAGDGWVVYEKVLSARLKVKEIYANYFPQAKHVASLGLVDFLAGKQIPAKDALPVYLYGAECWKKTGV